VLASRNLAADGIDVLPDFSRTSEGEGLMERPHGPDGDARDRRGSPDHVTQADDGCPSMLRLQAASAQQ
jgi:hypothetical protein